MQHPILRTLLARLRAFEAMERASFALSTIDALMEPFERHRIRIGMAGQASIISMGESVQALFGPGAAGCAVASLFRPADGAFVERLIESLVKQELGCHCGATAATASGVPVALEGLFLPEPPETPYGPVEFVSLCLVRSDFPGDIARLDQLQPVLLCPLMLGPTRYITLDNRGADRASLYKARWPRPDMWSGHR